MKTETIDIKKLKPDAKNARAHSTRNLDAIKASLTAFGQQKPIVVGPGFHVVAGNGTLDAAKALGWSTLECVRTKLKGKDAAAFAIADNRTAELAEWDQAELADTLKDLKLDEEFDHLSTGFTDAEIADLLGEEAEIVEDEAPEPPANPVTQPGDLIVMGKHRLLCGDSTKAEDVARLMGGEKADGLFTDPPYGIAYKAMEGGDAIANDETSDTAADVIAKTLELSPHDVGFVCCDWRSMPMVLRCLENNGIVVKACIVWDKQRGVQNLDRYYKQHEMLLYYGPFGGTKTQCGDVWQCSRDFDPDHPTPKPVGLVTKALTTANIKTIYDPFIGSGTTLIAAEQLGRTCYGMEISPAYCDVIVQRWETLTGKTAERPTLVEA